MVNKSFIIFIILVVFAFLFTALTLNDVGITWDEPPQFGYAKLHSEWIILTFKNLSNFNLTDSFKKETINKYWRVNLEHPPLVRATSGITYLLFSDIVGKINAYRFATVILFSLLVGFIYLFMEAAYGTKCGLFSAVAFLFMPCVFGHAHVLSYDIYTAFFTLICVYTFILGLENYRYSIIFAICFGLALSTRFSCVFIIIPLLIFSLLFYREESVNNIYTSIFISPIIFFLSFPLLWHDTFLNLSEYIRLNLTRSYWNYIPVYYFGDTYTYAIPRPYHYPFFMTIATLPVVTLIMIFVGIVKMCSSPKRIDLLIALSAIVPMLPFVNSSIPVYDGIRLFLQSFVFLACIAGIGFTSLIDVIDKKLKNNIKNIVKYSFTVILIIFVIYPLFKIRPFYLEYYSEIIGGVKGAHNMGLETTFWFNTCNREFLEYLNKNLPKDAKVLFSPIHPGMIKLYINNDMLRDDIKYRAVSFIKEEDIKGVDYLVLNSRQGCFTEIAWKYYLNKKPIYSLTYDGVPLISLYKVK